MKRYVAMLTTVFLLALAAAAQSKAQPKPAPPPNFGSAHGLCGPAHPNVEAVGGVIEPTGTWEVSRLTRYSDLVLVGRPSRISPIPTPHGSVETAVTFPHPLVLKSPVGGSGSGQPVTVKFPGGTALVNGICTAVTAPATPLRLGGLYLVFARFTPPGAAQAHAFPVDEKTAALGASGRGPLRRPAGHSRHLLPVISQIRAEVASEAAGPRPPAGPGR